jgi:hypothetical protein
MNNGPLGFGGEDPSSTRLKCKYIKVHGRKEHEAIIRDAKKCAELGLDQMYEIMVYLKRWNGWLQE